MTPPRSWHLSIILKNAGGALYELIPPEKLTIPGLEFDSKDFRMSVPVLAALLGERLPLVPEAHLTLLRVGKTSYLLPTAVILKNPGVFLWKGTLFLNDDIDEDILHSLPVFRDADSRATCPLFVEDDGRCFTGTGQEDGNLPFLHLSSMSPLLENPVKYADRFFGMARHRKPSELLYLPGCGTPASYPLLSYLGVGLFDSWPLIQAARREERVFPGGSSIPLDQGDIQLCYCQACYGDLGAHYDYHLTRCGIFLEEEEIQKLNRDFSRLLYHNCYAALQGLGLLRHAIRHQDFRSFVERSVAGHGKLVSLLRLVDRDHYQEMEPSYPLATTHQLKADSAQSLHRPDIRRYHHRLKTRYRKSPWKDVLVLLPCSARKPYSFSRSHKLFTETIHSGVRRAVQYFKDHEPENTPAFALKWGSLLDRVHKLIITSPMGIVPSELEIVSPVKDYDIPVTGDWSGEERELVTSLLGPYLKENGYRAIIHHTPYRFVGEFLEKEVAAAGGVGLFVGSGGHHPTSPEGLEALKSNVFEALKLAVRQHGEGAGEDGGGGDVQAQGENTNIVEKLLWHQFGDCASALLENSEIRGKYPYLKLFSRDTGLQRAILNPKKGLFSLTLEGGGLLRQHGPEAGGGEFCVEIDFLPENGGHGDIFTVGIKQASPDIRAGDEVVLVYKKGVVGVGSAVLNGEELECFKKGKGVRVRHWVKRE